ncbi:MAG: hypothetical protein ACPGTS_02350, partial [Minisyncoccia bacterium]
GASVFNPKKPHQFNLKTGEFFFMLKWLGQNCKMKNIVAVVENPNLNKAVFGQWERMNREIKRKASTGELRSVFAQCLNRAQSVGRNKEAAKIIIRMLHKKGVPVLEVSPSDRERADKKKDMHPKYLKMPTKTSQDQFQKLTGYSGQSAEHARDAHTMLHDRNLNWFWTMYRIQEEERSKTPNAPGQGNSNYSLVQRKRKTS